MAGYGNTVGSRQKVITWSREIRLLQQKLKLTSLQRNVLLGTLFGDGCLIENASGKNYRLKIEHGKKQKEYVEWKHRIFKEWCLSGIKFQQKTQSWRFKTISHPAFTELHEMFYERRKKVLPQQAKKFLSNPLSLAIWFMDDGGKLLDKNGKGRAVLFNIQQLSIRDVVRLQKILIENFSLPTTKQKNHAGYRLYLPRRYCGRFNDLVGKYILPILKYKLISV